MFVGYNSCKTATSVSFPWLMIQYSILKADAFIESGQLKMKNSINQQIGILILQILLIHVIKTLFLLKN